METARFNASQVAHILNDLYRGPFLFAREVEVVTKDGKPASIKGTVVINNFDSLVAMNGKKFPDELVIAAAKQFAILLQRASAPSLEPVLTHCSYTKDAGSTPESSFIVDVHWGESYEDLKTFNAYITEGSTFAAQINLTFYK